MSDSGAAAYSTTVLLVEDSSPDILFAREIVTELPFPVKLEVVRDGEQALAYLRRQGRHRQAPDPDLVLLDINMPRKGGFEVLAELRGEPEHRLARMPVVVVTHSNTPEDRARARELGASGVLVKPLDPERLADVMEAAGAAGAR
jgi:two-component system, chemotaxis family, response regulator Rcp1